MLPFDKPLRSIKESRKKSLQNVLLAIAKMINPSAKSQTRGQNKRSKALK